MQQLVGVVGRRRSRRRILLVAVPLLVLGIAHAVTGPEALAAARARTAISFSTTVLGQDTADPTLSGGWSTASPRSARLRIVGRNLPGAVSTASGRVSMPGPSDHRIWCIRRAYSYRVVGGETPGTMRYRLWIHQADGNRVSLGSSSVEYFGMHATDITGSETTELSRVPRLGVRDRLVAAVALSLDDHVEDFRETMTVQEGPC